MKYTCINIQGNFISEEVLQKIESATAESQKSTDFGFDPGTNLRDEIEYSWSRIKLDWKHFSEKSSSLPSTDQYGTTLARKWMENFLSSLGYDLIKQKEALKGENNQTYAISHVDTNNNGLPVQIVGFHDPLHPEKNTLDAKSSGGTSRLSPHGTVQEYLNVTEHIYGFATNGMVLRLIRDSGRLVKLTYIEFDLKRMMDEDKYSEFTILYRLIHSSRFINEASIIEKYYQESIETGNRIRDGLSEAVKESMQALGNGFLQHPANESLREKLKGKEITPKQYYDQLRRLVYRLLFLMVTEERDLIYDPNELNDEVIKKKQIYLRYYSIARLRNLSQNRYLFEKEFTDLWQGLLKTFFLFEAGGNGAKIGIKPLDGDLFSETALKDISGALIGNHVLLECIRNLNEFQDRETKMLVSINYRSLDVEELGSVYEGLLELHPVIEHLDSLNPGNIHFTFHGGSERKTTGSYYTRPDLVNELIKSTLIPVIEERIKENGNNKDAQLTALIKLKVCDAAAGSGHMILAAARTIAWHLARIDSGEENPAPSVYRHWLRQAIQHCVYAVDMNPDAVELCKLALWLEGHNSGKPLSFLDHKIRCGNSLVGVTDLKVLTEPIPDDAFNPLPDDDKKVSQDLKKKNKDFAKTKQTNLFSSADQQIQFDKNELTKEYNEIEKIAQDSVEAVREVKKRFGNIRKSVFHEEKACDIWTSAFFKTYSSVDDPKNPSSEKLAQYFLAPTQYGQLVGESSDLALKHKFFHWPLEFPDVYEQGGFDVMLGNPPWEKLQAEEEEFFRSRDNSIADEKDASIRKRKIEELKELNPTLYNQWTFFRNSILKTSKFIIYSNRFPYSAKGNLNLYKVFVEHVRTSINIKGRGGLVVQSGLFTDELSKELFESLMANKNLISVYDFVNTNKIFQIHGQMRFSLITLSKNKNPQKALFKFYLKSVEEISKNGQGVQMDFEDIKLINPNTFVCPQISSQYVFDLLKYLYSGKLVINSPIAEKSFGTGFWGEMFNMTRATKFLHSTIDTEDVQFIPLYEAKYFHQFDHRFATFEGQSDADCLKGNTNYLDPAAKENLKLPKFRYYVNRNEVISKCEKYEIETDWLLCVRSVTSATNERTVIASVLPKFGVGNSANIALINDPLKACHLIGTLNSMITDFIAQTKVGNQNFNIYIIEQLPILEYNETVEWAGIINRVLELVYTSWDIKPFADDLWKNANEGLRKNIEGQWQENKIVTGGYEFTPPKDCKTDPKGIILPPFKWNEERRAVIRAELDAIYARLYGLTEQQLRFILDPKDVFGQDFTGETFRVLKDREIRKNGEYLTKRLVLEAWNKVAGTTNIGLKKSIALSNVDNMKEFNLHEGIYSIKDTAEITGLSKEKIKRWFKELSAEQYEGLDTKQQTDVDKMRISFHGLIEVVVIGTLRENNFSLKKILKARADLYEKTQKIYPFATNNVKERLKVSGRDIVFEFANDTKVTLDGTGQINIDFITQFFRDIVFDVDGVAQRLIPSKGKGKVVIDPKEGGGKPSIVGKEIWVDLINNIYTGPNSITMIKDQYNLDEDEILAAVEFSQ